MHEAFEDGCVATLEPTAGDLTDGFNTGIEDDAFTCTAVAIE